MQLYWGQLTNSRVSVLQNVLESSAALAPLLSQVLANLHRLLKPLLLLPLLLLLLLLQSNSASGLLRTSGRSQRP